MNREGELGNRVDADRMEIQYEVDHVAHRPRLVEADIGLDRVDETEVGDRIVEPVLGDGSGKDPEEFVVSPDARSLCGFRGPGVGVVGVRLRRLVAEVGELGTT